MKTIKPLPLWKSVILFGVPSIFFLVVTNIGIPYITGVKKIHPALAWFTAGYFVFVPLFAGAFLLAKREDRTLEIKGMLERLRIRRLSREDWIWTLGSSGAILALTGAIMGCSKLLSHFWGIRELQTTPPFMQFHALAGYERLYLLVWLPMFFFNIVGEELLWRGYILPRQEADHGRKAWMINSALWAVFHICFGVDLLIILLPILLIIPYTAYKRKNTLIGILSHALLNGPMFVLVSLGLIG